MKKLLLSLALLGALTTSSPILANNYTEQLGSCLIDSLNGKERKNLGKWVFLAIAAHPEIAPLSKATNDDRLATDKYVGELITRLLTENCPQELVKANNADPMALNHAFELVGKVAMQELMTNDATMRALTNYAHFTDQEKINTLLAK